VGEVAGGEAAARPMVARGGRRGYELEARRVTVAGEKMCLTLQISERRDLKQLPT
jgi:hypothetical protein